MRECKYRRGPYLDKFAVELGNKWGAVFTPKWGYIGKMEKVTKKDLGVTSP